MQDVQGAKDARLLRVYGDEKVGQNNFDVKQVHHNHNAKVGQGGDSFVNYVNTSL